MLHTDRGPSEGRVMMDQPGVWRTFSSAMLNNRAEYRTETTPTRFSNSLAEDNTDAASLDTHSSITSKPHPQEFPEPIKEYGERRSWEWSSEAGDYVVIGQDGKQERFTEHQMAGIPPPAAAPASSDPDHNIPHPDSGGETQARGNSQVCRVNSIPRVIQPPQPQKPQYGEPLGPEFSVISKPKRFFSTGRIFATVWFEPSTEDMTQQQTKAGAWSNDCPAFHGQKPVARIRWFVVVRRRTHHSLCFTVTTYAGKDGNRTNRGRAGDHAVLYRANLQPEPPYDDEDITRDAIAVIIEDAEYYISPLARLDCGRTYTVEDNLKVAKVGRVHPRDLSLLEQYYRDTVL
ncbi:uncharacterized protein B0H64DRAFT_384211 [Chaetomium fimeti]|uniref:DUF6590 domain-containing protein n=1 Tax=Chaetomium fimeti TaxID=1854472 RepID=A0AAE0HL06_9PEZI|nr:hypothetical protein B0H64DRAFT_384211 [Chaetomium fimeti]